MLARLLLVIVSAFGTIILAAHASAQSGPVVDNREAQRQQYFSAYRELCLMRMDLTASYCVWAARQVVESTNMDAMTGGDPSTVLEELLDTGCTLEDGRACMWRLHPGVRLSYSSSDLIASFRNGVRLLGPECQQGDASSCRYFAEGLWWFSQGGTLPEQLQGAMPAALKRSCDLGDKSGCLALAEALAGGTHGFPQNTEAASNLRNQLCEQEFRAACPARETVQSNADPVDFGALNYGVAELGVEVGGVDENTFILYLEACAFDHAEACEKAGYMLFYSEHAPRDPGLGLSLYEKSCELGQLDGCIAAGFVHQIGDGVPENHAQAQVYYDMACDLGKQTEREDEACRGFR